MHLVAKIASPLQLTVVERGKALSLEWNGLVLVQRNSILRALAGYALQFQLDLELLGGMASNPMGLAAMTQWMSAATQGVSMDEALEAHLQENSFLAPSAAPSLADFDVALTLLAQSDRPAIGTATYRWMSTISAHLQEMGARTGVSIPNGLVLIPSPAPVFFFGAEDASTVLQPPKAAAHANKKEQPKREQEKKQPAKKEQPKKVQPVKPAPTDEVDISALDIRVGKIVRAWHHEEADKLFCEEIDLGTETRQIASGLRPFYQTEDLQDRMVLVLCNLKKRNLVGFPSHGMVLCASNDDHTKVEFVVPPEGSQLGERVTFEGFEGEPEPENKIAKKKIFEKLSPDLKTDTQGQVIWKESVARTGSGVVKALNGMPGAHVS